MQQGEDQGSVGPRAAKTPGPTLFISYRREDTRPTAARLFAELEETYGREHMFFDRERLEGGAPWPERLDVEARRASVMLVLIGDKWLRAQDPETFVRRLDQEGDWVRKEIEAALDAGALVVPLLVEEAKPLSRQAFAMVRSLARLADLQALTLRSNDWASDLGHLQKLLEERGFVRRKSLHDLANKTSERAKAELKLRDKLRSEATRFLNKEHIILRRKVHPGDLSQVFIGSMSGNRVAVKIFHKNHKINSIAKLLDKALEEAHDESHRHPSLINIVLYRCRFEPRYIVMDYIGWATLDNILSRHNTRKLDPLLVARILSRLAEAQYAAHSRGLPLGSLSPSDIYVDTNRAWEIKTSPLNIRVSPVKIEALITSLLGIADGLTFRWEALSRLPPELYEGHLPTSPSGYDSAGQYHLGLLGLELLRGNKPAEVTCLAELDQMRALYLDPCAFFIDPGDLAEPWTKRSPALSFVISRLLERDPLQRYADAKEAAKELKQIADDQLPGSIVQLIDSDYNVIRSPEFGKKFYDRLFSDAKSEHLNVLFPNQIKQHAAFSSFMSTIMTLGESKSMLSQFLASHSSRGISTTDVDVFQKALLAQIEATFPNSPRKHAAWKVVLHHPFDKLRSLLETRTQA